MTVLTLNREDVLKVLPKVDVFSTVEAMFGALVRGKAVQPKQVQTLFPNDKGDFINYTGVWMSAGVYGLKTSPFIVQEKGYTVTAWTLLMSTETGNPLLLVDSSRLTLERTAATTAVAVKYLARKDAKHLAVIGTGAQALAHIRYVFGLRDWESVRVWSLNSHELTEDKREEFKAAAQGRLEFVSSKAEALQKADVILLCTSAAQAVISTTDIKGAPLITSISTNAPGAHEVDPAMLAKMDVYCDCTATTATVAGEMKLATEAGTWKPERVKGDLGALVNKACEMPAYDRPVYFRSIGQGLEDVAVALAVYKEIKNEGDQQ